MTTENDRNRQRGEFLGGEGDRWFDRNRGDQIAPYMQFALDSILPFVRSDHRLLEVGCANGRNLAYIAQSRPGLQCAGVEPSAAAVEDARMRHPKIRFEQGSADRLPFDANHFDVVVFGFCLYLVDRELLFQAMAEADRVLRDQGFLVIIDFDPVGPRKRPYRHLDGVFSYKMDYSAAFVASGHYRLAQKSSFSHAGRAFEMSPADRVGTVILHKNVAAAYFPESD
jgi:ubiquinone/menaquinone biosynthesis C-methylase UbiE